jgi:hypothetical protein
MNSVNRNYDYSDNFDIFRIFSMDSHILPVQDQEQIKLRLNWPSPMHLTYPTDTQIETFWILYGYAKSIRNVMEDSSIPRITIQGFVTPKNTSITAPRIPAGLGVEEIVIQDMQMDNIPTFQARPMYNVIDDNPDERQDRLWGAQEAHAGQEEAVPSMVDVLSSIASVIPGAAGISGGLRLFNTAVQTARNLEQVKRWMSGPSPVSTERGERTAIRPNFYGNMSTFAPGDSFQNINDRGESDIMDSNYIGASSESLSFAHLNRLWSYLYDGVFKMNPQTIFSLTAAPYTLGRDYVAGLDGVYDPGWLSWSTQFYRWWRGSLEFRIMVFGNPMVPMRVNWAIIFDQGQMPASAGLTPTWLVERMGQTLSGTFLVEGTTDETIVVPFIRRHLWDRVGDLLDCAHLVFNVVSMEPQARGATYVEIPFIVFRRAGKDFCFKSFDAGISDIDEPPIQDMQMAHHGGVYLAVGYRQYFTFNHGTTSQVHIRPFSVNQHPYMININWQIVGSSGALDLDFDFVFDNVNVAPAYIDGQITSHSQFIETSIRMGDILVVTNNGPTIDSFSYEVWAIDDTAVTLPIPGTAESIPQPLWVSNYKVSDSPDGISEPVWITNYQEEIPEQEAQVKVNVGSEGSTLVHAPVDFELMCHRMQRGDDTINFPSVYVNDATVESYTAAYLDSTLTSKLATCSLYWCGTRGYKLVFPRDVPYETIAAYIPVTKNIFSTATVKPYTHVEIGTCMTDQNTIPLIEFDFPFQSQFPCYFSDSYQATLYPEITTPLAPILFGHNSLDITPAPRAIYENVKYDFKFYVRLPPSNFLRAYSLTNKIVS